MRIIGCHRISSRNRSLLLIPCQELCDGTGCLQREQVVKHNLHIVLAGLDDDLDSIDARTANLKEIISSTHLLNLQDVREDATEKLFHFSLRSHILGGTLHFGCRQYFTINLTIGRHGHDIQLHIGIGHHIVGQ